MGMIEISQDSGKATKVQGDFDSLTPDTEYFLRINKLGKLGADCMDTGDEYNPLYEVYQGEANPKQDPTRGRIDLITSESDGTAELHQYKLLHNLAGGEALIGKSVSLYIQDEYAADPDTAVPRACCVLGQNVNPNPPVHPAPEPVHSYANYGKIDPFTAY